MSCAMESTGWRTQKVKNKRKGGGKGKESERIGKR